MAVNHVDASSNLVLHPCINLQERLSMAEVQLDSFVDAFGTTVYPGDAVVYVLGDRWSKRLVQGIVEKIGYNEERIYAKTRYYIRLTSDSHYPSSTVERLSPMEDTRRIVKMTT